MLEALAVITVLATVLSFVVDWIDWFVPILVAAGILLLATEDRRKGVAR